jgi:hypothetical protein
MATRILGPAGSPKRRRFLFAPVLLASLLAILFAAGSARGVHDLGLFELDKNATNDLTTTHLAILNSSANATQTTIQVCRFGASDPSTPFTILIDAEQMSVTASAAAGGGGCPSGTAKRNYTVTRHVNGTTAASHAAGSDVTRMVTGLVAGDDWNQVYDEVQADPDTTCADLGAVECAFVHDGTNASIFTGGGSKDDHVISDWRWTNGSVPDADEINDAMAAKYLSASNDEILYFAADRFAVNGAKDFGFWFFQDQVQAEDDGTFSGSHTGTLLTPGDVLVLGTFTQGGATTTVRVFKWVGSGGTDGSLDADATLGDCAVALSGDQGCGTVNDTTIPTGGWAYQGKASSAANVILSGGFVEGGINLSALGLEGCFSSFMAETRSSPEIGAQLKDFILGQFQACNASITTQASDDSFEIGGSITDNATVSVLGGANPPAPTGFVNFYVCGPSDGITSCDTSGTPTGHIDLSTATVNGNDYTVTSDAFTPTSAGDYCFYAEYPANQDPNYPEGAFLSDFTDECFTVTPKQPAITTEVNDAGPLPLGSALDDTAHLSGTANQPDGDPAGGTITFTAYGPHDNTTTCNTVAYTSVVNVNGDGDYTASSGTGGTFIPTEAGTYNWIAVYSGDPPNTLGVSGSCGDANEGSVIGPNQPAIVTQADAGPVPLGSVIDDTATLSGTANQPDGDPAGGTITFTAYGPHDNTTTCDTVAYTSVVNVSGDGDYTASSGTGGVFIPTEAGTYNWIAVYSGDPPNTLGVSGSCGDANEGSVIISLQPTMSTAQNFVPNDSATITVDTGSGPLAGTVVFQLFVNDADCSEPAAYTSDPIDITTGSGGDFSRTVVSGNTAAYDTDGTTFSWVVTYTSSNPGHRDVSSPCGNETSNITINNGVTQPPPSP